MKSTALGKVLGPALVKGLAVTGSDPYLREGSDITVIFQVANRRLFLAAVEGFLREARKVYGQRLHEGARSTTAQQSRGSSRPSAR